MVNTITKKFMPPPIATLEFFKLKITKNKVIDGGGRSVATVFRPFRTPRHVFFPLESKTIVSFYL